MAVSVGVGVDEGRIVPVVWILAGGAYLLVYDMVGFLLFEVQQVERWLRVGLGSCHLPKSFADPSLRCMGGS